MTHLRRHILPLITLMISFVMVLSGCERKDLYLAQRGTIDVNVSVYNINLDLLWGLEWKTQWQYLWDESLYGPIGYTEPTGVRANVYSLNEERERIRYTTRNFGNEGGRVSLTTCKTYDMAFYNNDTEYILFSTDESNAYYHATTRSNARAAYTRAYAHYNQPDQLFGTFLQDLYVTEDPEAYEIHYDNDGSPYYVYHVHADLTPYTMIYLCQVMVLNNEDENGKRITGCQGISMNGLSGGVDLFTRMTDSTNLVTITQEETRPMQTDRDLTLPDGTKTVGDIMAARILTWGLPGIDPLANVATRTYAEPRASVHAGIGLTLRNGNVYTIEEDITEQIRKRPAGGVITIVIDADELPDNIVGEEPKPGGGFDASVENWENEIEEEIII